LTLQAAGHYGLEASKKAADKLVVEAVEILGKINGDTSGLKEIALYFTKRDH
jgi:hypothetical protein